LCYLGLDPASLYPNVLPRPGPLPAIGRKIRNIGDQPRSYNQKEWSEEVEELEDALSPVYDQLSIKKWWWRILEYWPIRQRYQKANGIWVSELRFLSVFRLSFLDRISDHMSLAVLIVEALGKFLSTLHGLECENSICGISSGDLEKAIIMALLLDAKNSLPYDICLPIGIHPVLTIVSEQGRRVVWLGQRRRFLDGINWTSGSKTVRNGVDFNVARRKNVLIVLVDEAEGEDTVGS